MTSELTGGAAACMDGSDLTFENCYFAGNQATDHGGGVSCFDSRPTLSNCTFVDNVSINGGGGAVFSGWDGSPFLTHCTMVGNSAAFGAGVLCYQDASAELEHCIIAFGASGPAVSCISASTATLICCDLFGNAGGDWVGSIAPLYGMAGNISEDPLFCGTGNPAGPYTLHENSPCAPDHNPGCGLLGAWPVGCGGAGSVRAGTAPVPAGLQLARSVPNPARGGARLDYTLPTGAGERAVSLRIYDATGHQVRSLVDANQPAGRYAVVWDGNDGVGQAVVAGVYFYRLLVGEEQLTRKLLVVR